MTFEELGSALRLEREKRGLTIDNVADQLKINPRLLLALEAGDFQSLPHPAYARGFIRSYASFLGFGQDEIQNMLAGMQPSEPGKQKSADKPKQAVRTAAKPEQEIQELPMPQKRARGSASWLAILVLCALAGGTWWAWDAGHLDFLKRSQEKPADLLQTLPHADDYLAKKEAARQSEPVPARPAPEPVIAGLSQPRQIQVAKPEPAVEEPEAKPQGSRMEPAQEAAADAAQESAELGPAESQEAAPEQHKLVIVAIEECWVHSNADKTDTRQFSLRKGDTFALTFAKSLDLKLGNAGGVRLRYDGRDLPPPGTSGQVRTISFPPKED